MKHPRRLLSLALLSLPVVAHAQTTVTPGVGLEVPARGSNNWDIPMRYDFDRLDQLLSGGVALPALKVTGDVQVGGTITAGSFAGINGAYFLQSTQLGAQSSGNVTGIATLDATGHLTQGQIPTNVPTLNQQGRLPLSTLPQLLTADCSDGTHAMGYTVAGGVQCQTLSGGGGTITTTPYRVQMGSQDGKSVADAPILVSTDGTTVTTTSDVRAKSINRLVSAEQSGQNVANLAMSNPDTAIAADNPTGDRIGYFLNLQQLRAVARPAPETVVVDYRNGSFMTFSTDPVMTLAPSGTPTATGHTCLVDNRANNGGACFSLTNVNLNAGFDNGNGAGVQPNDQGWDGNGQEEDLSFSNQAGIIDGHNLVAYALGRGDNNPEQLTQFAKPGATAGSDEGFRNGSRNRLYEAPNMQGTLNSTEAVGTDTRLHMTPTYNGWALGVLHPMIDLTSGVLSGNMSMQNGAGPGVAEVMTTDITVPVSKVGRVFQAVNIPDAPLEADSYSTQTILIASTDDYSGTVGQRIAFEDGTWDTDGVVTAVTANTQYPGVWNVTASIRHPHAGGVLTFVGGMAGRWLEATANTSSTLYGGTPSRYVFPVIGSDGPNSIHTGMETPGGFANIPNGNGPFKAYLGGHTAIVNDKPVVDPDGITELMNIGENVVMMGNDPGIVAGDTMEQAGTPSQVYAGPLDATIQTQDPYSVANGVRLQTDGPTNTLNGNFQTHGFWYQNNGGKMAWFLRGGGLWEDGLSMSSMPDAMLSADTAGRTDAPWLFKINDQNFGIRVNFGANERFQFVGSTEFGGNLQDTTPIGIEAPSFYSAANITNLQIDGHDGSSLLWRFRTANGDGTETIFNRAQLLEGDNTASDGGQNPSMMLRLTSAFNDPTWKNVWYAQADPCMLFLPADGDYCNAANTSAFNGNTGFGGGWGHNNAAPAHAVDVHGDIFGSGALFVANIVIPPDSPSSGSTCGAHPANTFWSDDNYAYHCSADGTTAKRVAYSAF